MDKYQGLLPFKVLWSLLHNHFTDKHQEYRQVHSE